MAQGIDITDELVQGQPWAIKSVMNFNGGINDLVRPEDVSDDELLVGINLRTEQNRTIVDHGYGAFGGPVVGSPRRSYQMFLKDGSSFQCLVTNASFYVWASGVAEWQYVSNGTSTTLAIAASATDLTITVVSDTGFTNGEGIGILLDDGTQHKTTINGVPAANVITLTDAIPSAAAIGKVVVEALALTGTDAEHVSVITVASYDWIMFANGADVPKRFDGSTVEDVPGIPAGLTTCNKLHQFGDYTIMLGTTEAGVALPQRVRVSDTGQPDVWTTGNATFYDLYATPGYIMDVANLGPYMMVYKSRSIERFEFVGSATQLFSHETMVTDEGAISRAAVVNLGDRHIFFGHANIFEYRGGFDIQPVGEKIKHKVFGSNGETNPAAVNSVFGILVEAIHEVWFFYPHGANTSPSRFLRYHLEHKSFYQRDLGITVTGFGNYISSTSRTWNDLVGTWIEQTWAWSSQLLLANSATMHMGSDGLQVYEYDYFIATDDTADISYQMDTRDFFLLNKDARFDRVDLRVKGSSVLVEYSTDEGANWNTWGTIVSKATLAGVTKLYKQVTANTIRFRISGSGAGFSVESFAFRFRPETQIT